MNSRPNNLDTFKILFLIKGILTLFFSLFFVFYASMGASFGRMFENTDDACMMPFNPGNIFMVIGIAGFILAIALGVLTLLTSQYIGERRNYIFIFVIAILNATTGVLGILLAVFTIIELNKPEVKELFGRV